MKALLISLVFAVSAFSQDTREPAELTTLRNSWTTQKAAAAKSWDEKYAISLAAMKDKFLKAGNLEAAVSVENELKALKVDINTVTSLGAIDSQKNISKASPKEITVEAYIDGPSTLHLSLEGIYWTNGGNAKPGRLGAHNYPTYINGKSWIPKWGNDGDDRGADKSDLYQLQFTTIEYELEVVGISDQQGSSKKDSRTAPSPARQNGELVVNIPDPEVGAKWYKIRLRLRK